MFDTDKFCRSCGAAVPRFAEPFFVPPQPRKRKLWWYEWVLIGLAALIVLEYINGLFDPGQQYIERSYYSERYETEEMVWLKTPDSTVISRIGYNEDEEVLGITFRKAGSTYYYYDYPSDLWEEFLDADSLIDYYNRNIRGQYSSSKGDY